MTTKELVQDLYWDASPPLMVEPFQASSPPNDMVALEASLSWGK